MPHTQPPEVSRCPSEETLASYLAGTLVGPERDEIEAHVAVCSICLEHVAAVGKMLSADSSAHAAELDDMAAAREGVRKGLQSSPKLASRCAKCGLINIPGSVYCRECGAVIPTDGLRCHSCRRVLPRDSKYCHYCGAPLLGLPPVETWGKLARWLLRNKWLVAAGISLGVAYEVHKFSVFLVLALLFGLKWVVDLQYAKTLITIYQSVHRGERKAKDDEIDRTLDRLRRP